MTTTSILNIVVSAGRRPLRDLTELAASINDVGLLNPITVTPDYRLVAGYHRLEACRSLGWTDIPVNIIELSAEDLEIAEIDENIVRHEFTVLDRAEQLKRRKEIYEAKHPETKQHVAGGYGKAKDASADSAVASFAKDTAKKTGRSTRVVHEEVQIARNITPYLKSVLRGTDLENDRTALIRISRMNLDQQHYLANAIRAESKLDFLCEIVSILEVTREEELYKDEYANFDDFWFTECAPTKGKSLDSFVDLVRQIAPSFHSTPLVNLGTSRTKEIPEARFFWNTQASQDREESKHKKASKR